MITFDTSLLSSYYNARSGVGLAAAPAGGTGKTVKLPTPPWDYRSTAAHGSDLLKHALLGGKFIDVGAAQLDVRGASEDYQKLFALYQGLDALRGVAEKANVKGVGASELTRLQSIFARGLGEIGNFTDGLDTDLFRIARGEVAERLRSASGVRRDNTDYVTGAIHQGQSSDAVAAFQGDVKFTMSVKRLSATTNVSFDLAEMGSQPRTLANVINYLNSKLEAAGAFTRFASQKLPNEPRVVQVGGKTVTLPAVADSWALKVDGDNSEQVSFSAPATAGAVYLAQSVGKAPTTQELADGKVDLTQRQLLKFQTDTAATIPAVEAKPSDANWVAGRAFADTLGPQVSAVRATAAGPDGSVYILADVTGKVDGQSLQGASDVALMKYDSAGRLMFTRTLGAADKASGYALAVSADGKVAIAGSVSGQIDGVTIGPTNSTDASGKADSFVTLFNADGEEQWTVRRGAREDDLAQAVAFGADGTVYVAGRTSSSLPDAASIGGWDNYLTAYATQSTGAPKALFTQQFGSTGEDKIGGIAVNGAQVVVAGLENGEAVVRSFAVSSTSVTTTRSVSAGVLTVQVDTATDGVLTNTTSNSYPTDAGDGVTTTSFVTSASATAGAVRSLGDLQGGTLAGVGFNGADIVVAGTTNTGALSAGTPTTGYTGGRDAFVAKLGGDLSVQATDRVSFFGGDGDDYASGMTVAGGQVYIAGSTSSTSLDGKASLGTKDGYAAQIDPLTGAVAWSTRFTAKDGVAAPTSIAVDVSGSSVLDRLGLPKGALDFMDSQLITAGSSVRPGDQFYIRSREGARPTAITIEAKDTLQTLAQKIRRAAGFAATVDIVRDGDYANIQIRPANDRTTVEIIAGRGGKDALDALGLAEGVARRSGGAIEKDKKIYGLKLSSDLDLRAKDGAKTALAQLDAALTKIRSIYRDLKTAATPQTPTSNKTGEVPAYLKAQLANYQSGLSRLVGGG